MKTYKKVYERICSLENLALAYKKARKGKSKKDYVLEFEKNLEENLLNLQRELIEQTYNPKPLRSFIIFDNDSSEETRELIKKKYPKIDLIYSYKNEGYGRAVNYALQYAFKKYKSKYFIITDQDVKVERGYLNKLVEFMEINEDAAFTQPLSLQISDPTRIYSAGHIYKKNGRCFTIKKIDKNKIFTEIPSGSILCSIIRASSLRKVGLIDERFEIYYESSDWGFRFREEGFKNYCLYISKVYHEREQKKSTPFQMYFVLRNMLLFWAKHNKSIFKKCLNNYKKRLKKIEMSIKKKKRVNDPFLLSEYHALKDSINNFSNISIITEPKISEFNNKMYLIDSFNKKYF